MDQFDVVLDARWIGRTGIGRVTDQLLAGLRELRPSGRWAVWALPDRCPDLWEGATAVIAQHQPTSGLGQRGGRAMPRGNVLVVPHLVRPLMARGRAVVIAHDLIPVHHDPRRWARPLWRELFRWSAKRAALVIVYSGATLALVRDELHVEEARIRRVDLPVDPSLVRQIRERRAAGGDRTSVLTVGQGKPHKNLGALIAAFATTRFAREGGSLQIVGPSRADSATLQMKAAAHRGASINIIPRCAEDELVRLYADAAIVCQPSLEEGLGLAVLEAIAAGIPVCCSDIPPHREAAHDLAVYFDPGSPVSIADAIDACLLAARPDTGAELGGVTPRELAAAVLMVVEEAAGGSAR